MQHRPRFLPSVSFLFLLLVASAPPGRAAAETSPSETEDSAQPDQVAQPDEVAQPDQVAEPAETDEIEPATDPGATVIEVGEVQVTATRSERSILEVPGNVTVIDRKTIEESGARDVADLLRREAGIFVTNTTTNREGYTVEARGFNNGGGNGGRTLVLIDDRRVNEPNGQVPDWALIPLDNVESIEVVRGPVNALYGDNAIAGVIHIRTLRPEPGIRAIAKGRTGTYDTNEGSLWVGGQGGPVGATVYLEGDHTDGYRERSSLRARRGEADLSLDLFGRGTLGIKGGYDSQRRKRPGALTREEMAEDRRQAAPGSDQDVDDVRERFGQLYLDFAITDELTFRLDGWQRRRNDDTLTSDPFFAFALQRETDAGAVDAQLELDVEVFGHRSRTLLGGSFLQEDVDSDSVFQFPPFEPTPASDRSRRKLYGVFLQNELDLTEDLILTLGVRRESARYDGRERISGAEFHLKGDEWAPKAALTWRIVEPVSVYASYARGFRFPNMDEAFGFFGFSPNLGPETAETYEVGTKVRAKYLSLNLAAYHTNVDDEIFFDPLAPNAVDPLAFPGVNVNLDRVRHRGIEASGSLFPTEWLEIYGSFTYDDVKITRDLLTGLEGNRMPITPRYRGTAGARVHLPYGFEAGVNANYVGSRFVANDVTNSLEKLPRWASYDARVGWRHTFWEQLTLGFDVTAYNVTGRRYTEFGGRSVFSPRVGFYPAPGRHYMVGMQIELKR
jgi:outer membrane receptor protein involved in Fe transport